MLTFDTGGCLPASYGGEHRAVAVRQKQAFESRRKEIQAEADKMVELGLLKEDPTRPTVMAKLERYQNLQLQLKDLKQKIDDVNISLEKMAEHTVPNPFSPRDMGKSIVNVEQYVLKIGLTRQKKCS